MWRIARLFAAIRKAADRPGAGRVRGDRIRPDRVRGEPNEYSTESVGIVGIIRPVPD